MRRLLLDPRTRSALFLLWGLLWLWIGWLSLTPVSLPLDVSDKLLHGIGYALMSAAVAGFCHESRRLVGWAIAVVAIGGGLELVQALVPYRSCEALDLVVNAAGAAVGCLIGQAWLGMVIRSPARAGHLSAAWPTP